MKTVLFVCVHNAGRSQMAEALLNKMVAGTEINPVARQVMDEIGVPMVGQSPKMLTQAMADSASKVITMGCGVDADLCPARIHLSQDWGLDDPKGQSIEKVRAIRDQIEVKVEQLLAESGSAL